MASTKTVSRTRGKKAAGTPARSSTTKPAGAGTGRRGATAASASGVGEVAPSQRRRAGAGEAMSAPSASAQAVRAAPPRRRAAASSTAAPARRSGTPAKRPKTAVDPLAKLRAQVIEGLERIKARDIREIDVRGRASFADLLVIASGTSTTHVKSIADEVIRHAKRIGAQPLGVEGAREAEWVLVDLGDIVVHVMLPRVREFYALERLWTVGAEEPAAAASA